jgi:hypothetical protein
MKKHINSLYIQIRKVKIIMIFICILFANKTYSQWSSVGGGMDYNVYTLFVDSVNNELYAGGSFTTAGGIPAGHIAKWDGTNWYDLAGGIGDDLSEAITSICFYNGEIYAAGLFDSAGGNPANNIAKWDGISWSNVGNGFNRTIYSIVTHNGDLYALGDFDSSGTNAVSNIAKWDGTNWVDVGGGTDFPVLTGCSFNNELYIGGFFLNAAGVNAPRIAKWDGINWAPVGGGFNNYVRKIYVFNGELYAGGDFTLGSGNISVKYISKLVNNVWQALPYPTGGGIYNTIRDFVNFNGDLYITGRFTSVPYIGKFNGTNYNSLGSGLSYVGESMAVYNNELYVGGYFSSAVGVPLTNCIAKWNPTVGEFENLISHPSVGPNPFINNTVFYLPNSKYSECNLMIYDVVGNLVRSELIAETKEYKFERRNLVVGVYLYSIVNVNKSIISNGKLVIVDQ